MEILAFLVFLILLLYCSNILYLVYGFFKVKSFAVQEINPTTQFSIIVPFRNEEENLPKLLHSISLLDYPMEMFEVILVNDTSDFKFQISDFRPESLARIGESYPIQIIDTIRISNSPKKDAINIAIAIAKNEWIITTDADCLVQPKWLQTIDQFIQTNNPKMIASGVSYISNTSFLDAFQQLDLLSLQGTTIGSFGNENAFMCNGANFCYQKSFFKELNGFDGNTTIASGDDVFLLQKAITKDKKNVHFLLSESAILKTKTEKSWKDLFYQRVRWASKTANYTSFYSKQLGISVLIMNVSIVILLAAAVLGFVNFLPFTIAFTIKFITDYLLLAKTSSVFKVKLRYLLLGSLLYPFFTSVVGTYALFGSYTWKGRNFKK